MARRTKDNPMGWGWTDSLRLARRGAPMLAFLWWGPGKLVNRLLWRWKPFCALKSHLVSREIRRLDPDHDEAIKRGMADADAGRLYKWNSEDHNAPMVPSESWQPDDPQQPKGWHHDGTKWALNDDGGWFADDSGFYRYNKPGEVGWVEQPDGSWKYLTEPKG